MEINHKVIENIESRGITTTTTTITSSSTTTTTTSFTTTTSSSTTTTTTTTSTHGFHRYLTRGTMGQVRNLTLSHGEDISKINLVFTQVLNPPTRVYDLMK